MKEPLEKVYVGIPCYGGLVNKDTVTALIKSSRQGLMQSMSLRSYSLLPQNFNMLYCDALNSRSQGITHFCLMHDDVLPEDGWLDKMMGIMKSYRASILSAIIPIKTKHGLTSTALDEPVGDADPHFRVRRLTMTEVFQRLPTFTEKNLLLNTGLMLIDLRQPWVEKVWFEFENKIIKKDDGQFVALGMSEDWAFSRKALALGANLFATREVKVFHEGTTRYHNASAWGSLKEDSELE